jgi:Zn-dependent peptidase ImmA (M78 family)/transcriptional regulator with XRE-family HTH domain
MANDNILLFPSALDRPGNKRRLNSARLKDARLVQRLNQSDLARVVGVTRQAVSAYEQGEKTPDSDTMGRIADALQQPLSYFFTDDRPDFGPLSAFFFRAFGTDTKRRNMACGVISKWFVQTARYFDNFVNYPPVQLPHLSPASTDGRYETEEIELVAEDCRKLWGLGLGPISNVVALLETKGITVSRYEIPGERVEAFSFWSGDRPFILLASEKQSASRSRFDAAHELGHLILHRWVGPDELEDPKVLKLIEREADRFASAFLLPRKSFPTEVFTTRLDAFVDLKRRWKVSVQAMVYRCKALGIFDEDQVTNLYKQISARKWRTTEPLDDPNILPLEQPRLLRRAVEMIVGAGRKVVDEIVAELQIARHFIETFCNLPQNYLSMANITEFAPTLK